MARRRRDLVHYPLRGRLRRQRRRGHRCSGRSTRRPISGRTGHAAFISARFARWAAPGARSRRRGWRLAALASGRAANADTLEQRPHCAARETPRMTCPFSHRAPLKLSRTLSRSPLSLCPAAISDGACRLAAQRERRAPLRVQSDCSQARRIICAAASRGGTPRRAFLDPRASSGAMTGLWRKDGVGTLAWIRRIRRYEPIQTCPAVASSRRRALRHCTTSRRSDMSVTSRGLRNDCASRDAAEIDPPDLRSAHVIVVANEKAAPESTLSIHISVALLKAGFWSPSLISIRASRH